MRIAIFALAASAVVLSVAPLHAAQVRYTIQRVGLSGTDYVSSQGNQASTITFLSDTGMAAGYSLRYSGTAYRGRDAWLYNGNTNVQIGLVGAGYEQIDGTRLSSVVALNNSGQAVGRSVRNGSYASYGDDVWLYDSGNTVRIGYTGAGYVRSDGYAQHGVVTVTNAGQVFGGSVRWSGMEARGSDAWLYDSGNTVQLGYTGGSYENNVGYRTSGVRFVNANGQAVGYSQTYDDVQFYATGNDEWLYSGGSTIRIGLTGAGYETSDIHRYSTASQLNEAGQAIGSSRQVITNAKDAWLYNGVGTVQIGLTGAGYESSDGYRESEAQFLNEAGQVIGYSSRRDGTPYGQFGRDAWLYDGVSTMRLGLTGASYERSDGFRASGARGLNNAGQVIGGSGRYNGLEDNGQDAWFYDGEKTVQVGFTGTGYELNADAYAGYRQSEAQFLNDAGQSVGYSRRFGSSPGQDRGLDTWLYNGSDTVQIGLTGAGYEEIGTGTRYSTAQFLNEAGQVAGSSYRYTGGQYTGQSAWLYDADFEETIDLTLSIRPSDGYAFSQILYLGDDGLTLGKYSLFDQATGANLGDRAFVFTIEDGLYDLGSLVDDLSPDGWAYLIAGTGGNGIGNIIGEGYMPGLRNDVKYILTPTAVPIPAAAWLFASGLALLGWMRRRRTA